MKKIIKFTLFIFIILFIILNSYEIMESIRFSFLICINNLFPSLIPFMILSNILINYNFIEDISSIFSFIMEKLFKVNRNTSFAFVMSLISGTPSNAKYLKDLQDKNLITDSDIQKSLYFCHFTNPIFIIGTIGYTFLQNKKLGLIILISHYLSSIIIGLFNKPIKNKLSNNINFNIKRKPFIETLKESITSTINILLLTLGLITTFLILTTIIDNVFDIDDNYKFIYGLLEITQGLKYLSISNLSIKLKTIISTFIISFGGLSIHAQVFSIIDNKKIRYSPYFLARLIHGILSCMFVIILYKILF